MEDWQPIETAPRDGTPILVWFRGERHVAEFSPVWHLDNLKWIVRPPNTGLEGDVGPVHDITKPTWADGTPVAGGHGGPTHWMPLPTPPKHEGER